MNLRDAWRSLVRRLWPSPGDPDRSIREEIRFHTEMLLEEYLRAGMPREEARRRAAERFGDAGKVWLETRDASGVADPRVAHRRVKGDAWTTTVSRDTRYALRMLRRSPAFSTVVIVTLALGIGANTAMFSVVRGVLLRPLPWSEPDRLVRLWESNPTRGFPFFLASPPNFADWKAQSRSFEHLANFRGSELTYTGAGEPEVWSAARVSHDFFALLRVQPLAGRFFAPAEESPGADRVAVISEGLWRRRFAGDRDVIGRGVTLDDEAFTIIGVAPAEVWIPRRTTELWVPAAFDAATLTQARGAHYIHVIGRLKPGVSLEQAETEMKTIGARLEQQYPGTNTGWTVRAEPMHERVVGAARSPLWTLFGAVFLVLLIACANVANLMLVRASARHKEIAIQAALGASRGRVARQLLTESLLLAFGGTAAGLALAAWGIRALRAIGTDVGLPRAWDITLDPLVLGFAFGLALVTGLLFGVVPVFQMFRSNLYEGLREGGRASAGRLRQGLRSALVVAEVSLSLVLLVGAGLLLRSLGNLGAVELGLETQSRLTFQVGLPDVRYGDAARQVQFIDRVLESLQALPDVRSAAMISELPLGSDYQLNFGVFRAGETPGPDLPSVDYAVVSPGYFSSAEIPLLAGRDFGRHDTLEAPRAMVINRTMAERFFAGEDPLGQRLQIGRQTAVVREVVGVVGDVRRNGLRGAAGYQAYEVYTQAPDDSFSFLVRTTREPEAIVASARQAIWAIDRDVPITRVRSMDQVVAENLSQPRFRTVLLAAFSAFAVVLAAVGLYGVMAYAVERRTQEIGLRMALGAQRGDILRLVLRQGMGITLLGVALGTLGALWISKVLASQLFELAPRDPLTFGAAAGFLALVALAACWNPARRAVRVSPLEALLDE